MDVWQLAAGARLYPPFKSHTVCTRAVIRTREVTFHVWLGTPCDVFALLRAAYVSPTGLKTVGQCIGATVRDVVRSGGVVAWLAKPLADLEADVARMDRARRSEPLEYPHDASLGAVYMGEHTP